MSEVVFEKVEYRALNDIAYERIKRKIIDNEFLPGEKLDVVQLSRSLGVSRTPVVNAITKLAQDGFVTICPRSASYVREHTREEIEYIYDFREIMEGLAMHKIIGRLDTSRLRAMRERLIELQRRGFSDDIVDVYLDTAQELHEYMLELCPHIVRDKVENLVDLTKRLGKLHLRYMLNVRNAIGLADTEIQIHIELVDALLAGDAERAERCVRRDIRVTCDEVLENFGAIELFARGGL